MSTHATIDDIISRWDEPLSDQPTDPQHQRAQTLLDDAETLLLSKVPDLADRVADGRTDARLLAAMLARVVIRVLDNPKGYQSEHAGDVGYSRGSTGSPATAGEVQITRQDLARIGITSDPPGSIAVALPAHRMPANPAFGSGW